jgi:hypothetical protein
VVGGHGDRRRRKVGSGSPRSISPARWVFLPAWTREISGGIGVSVDDFVVKDAADGIKPVGGIWTVADPTRDVLFAEL